MITLLTGLPPSFTQNRRERVDDRTEKGKKGAEVKERGDKQKEAYSIIPGKFNERGEGETVAWVFRRGREGEKERRKGREGQGEKERDRGGD